MNLKILLLVFMQAAAITCTFVPSDIDRKSKNSPFDAEQFEHLRWNQYKTKYGIELIGEEEAERFKIYRANMEFIHLFNSQNHSFTLGENKFTHWSHEEYLVWLASSVKDSNDDKSVVKVVQRGSVGEASDRDWRTEGKVTPIKDQQQCGSCYAFSTLGVIESHYLISKNIKYDLSEQDLIDCSSNYGNDGCDGGLLVASYTYAKENGVSQESEYPYKNRVGVCKRGSIPNSKLVYIDGSAAIQRRDETTMAEVVSNVGPVSVALDASQPEFQFYKCGIYDSYTCKSTAVNHAVIIVGLGSSPAPHWIIKNSWATSWGQDGFMKLARGKNMCGVSQDVKYPTVAQ